MSRRVVCLAVAIALTATSAFAQNARKGALGGNPVVGDVTDVLTKPAFMSDYKDLIQATYNGGVGPLIAVKSIGDVVSAGITYQQGRVLDALDNGVYTVGAPGFLFSLSNVPNVVVTDVDPIPHLLFGIDLDPLDLALDLYYERALYNMLRETTAPGPPATSTTVEGKGSFNNMGLRLGMNLDPDVFPLVFAFGMGMPRISGESKSTTDGVLTQENKAETEKGLSLGGVLEVGVELFDLDWLIGATMEMLSYKGSFTDVLAGTPATVGDEFATMDLNVYLGFAKEFSNGLTMGLTETTQWNNDRIVREVPSPANTNVTVNSIDFLFIGSAEKEWTELKRLDALYGRCALTYEIQNVINRQDGEDATGTLDERIRNEADRPGFNALLGGGIAKGILSLDVEINVAQVLDAISWSTGNAAGNDLASATLTLDFTKLGSSGSSKSASAPEPYSQPVSEPADDTGLESGIEF